MKNKQYDVIVIGGGAAGVSAAMAAARNGMQVAIVEQMGFFGGLAVGSYVVALAGIYDGHDGRRRCIKGNFDTITKKLIKMKGATPTTYGVPTKGLYREVSIDPESMKYVLDTFMMDSNITCYLHSTVIGALFNKENVFGIVIWTMGRQYEIFGKMFIDASGDAHMAEYCGIPYNTWATYDKASGGTLGFSRKAHGQTTYSNKKKNIQWTEFGWLDTKNPHEGFFNDNLSVGGVDPLDHKAPAYLEMQSRAAIQSILKKLKKVPGFRNVYLVSTGDIFGARKTRHPITRHILTDYDLNECLPHSIAVAGNVMADYGYMEIPYETLIPEQVNNLWFVGRTIATMHSMKYKGQSFHSYEITRLVPICMATGEAAGLAAAICLMDNEKNHSIDIVKLQTALAVQGAVIHP
jgi:hypothetical protein